MPIKELKSQIKIEKTDDMLLDKLIALAQTRMNTLNDFYDLTGFIFEEGKNKLSDEEKAIAKKLLENFELINDWNKDAIFESIKKVLTEEKIRMPIVYKVVTGKEKGLPLPETLEILGKNKTIKILKESV